MGEKTRRPWSPWRHLREHYPDVPVHEVELPPGWLGCVDVEKRIVWLDSRLTPAERRSTLAHEIGHLERGIACHWAPTHPEEKAADEWAARRLIDIPSLTRALQWSQRLEDIAEELWVDVHIVRARLGALSPDEEAVVWGPSSPLVEVC